MSCALFRAPLPLSRTPRFDWSTPRRPSLRIRERGCWGQLGGLAGHGVGRGRVGDQWLSPKRVWGHSRHHVWVGIPHPALLRRPVGHLRVRMTCGHCHGRVPLLLQGHPEMLLLGVTQRHRRRLGRPRRGRIVRVRRRRGRHLLILMLFVTIHFVYNEMESWYFLGEGGARDTSGKRSC